MLIVLCQPMDVNGMAGHVCFACCWMGCAFQPWQCTALTLSHSMAKGGHKTGALGAFESNQDL